MSQEEGLNASQAKAAVSEMDQAIKGREVDATSF